MSTVFYSSILLTSILLVVLSIYSHYNAINIMSLSAILLINSILISYFFILKCQIKKAKREDVEEQDKADEKENMKIVLKYYIVLTIILLIYYIIGYPKFNAYLTLRYLNLKRSIPEIKEQCSSMFKSVKDPELYKQWKDMVKTKPDYESINLCKQTATLMPY